MGDGALVQELVTAREELLRKAAGLSEESLRARPANGEWSVIEVLAHLADVDRHWLGQAVAIRDGPTHLFVHFNDSRWKAEHPDARDRPLAQVVGALKRSFREVVDARAGLSDEELARAGRHPRGAPYRVRDVFLRYPVHDRNHARQIKGILEAIGDAP
jgi:uncharacterized damage-inducible protein DinB